MSARFLHPLRQITSLLLPVRSGGTGLHRNWGSARGSGVPVRRVRAPRAREYARKSPLLVRRILPAPSMSRTSRFAGLCGALDYNLVIPALFLWLERACYLAFGMTEWGMRLPAFVAGIAALLVMIPLARRVVGGPLRWLPVAFVALSRHAISHGAEVRPYTVDLLFSALILWATVVVLAEGRAAKVGLGAQPCCSPHSARGSRSPVRVRHSRGRGSVRYLVAAYQHGGRKRWTPVRCRYARHRGFGIFSLVGYPGPAPLLPRNARSLGGRSGWGAVPELLPAPGRCCSGRSRGSRGNGELRNARNGSGR